MWWLPLVFILPLVMIWILVHELAHAAGAWLDGRKITEFKPYPHFNKINFFGIVWKKFRLPYVSAAHPSGEQEIGLYSIGPLLLDLVIIPPLWVLSLFVENIWVWGVIVAIIMIGLIGAIWAIITTKFFQHLSDIRKSPKSCFYFSCGLAVFYVLLIGSSVCFRL